jgi:hypothetical protein
VLKGTASMVAVVGAVSTLLVAMLLIVLSNMGPDVLEEMARTTTCVIGETRAYREPPREVCEWRSQSRKKKD